MTRTVAMLSTLVMASCALSSPLPPADGVLHDARAVRDATRLRLEEIAGSGDGSWALIEITPSEHSGASTVVGADIDLSKPAPSGPVRGEPATMEMGSWELVAALGGPSEPRQAKYLWTRPQEQFKMLLDLSDLYPPFVKGGLVLGRRVESPDGGPGFDPVFLVPGSWKDLVEPAFEFVGRNAPALPPAGDEARAEALVAWLDHDNPLVVLTALRMLDDEGATTPERLDSVLARAATPLRACIAYRLLTTAADDEDEAGTGGVARLIATATSAAALEGPALAVFTATFDSTTPAKRAHLRQLMEQVKAKEQKLGGSTASNRYVRSIVEATGL